MKTPKFIKKILYNNIILTVTAVLSAIIVYIITKTIRIKYINKEFGLNPDGSLKKAIYAMWHNRLFLLTGLFAGSDYCAIISRSRDGDFVSKVAKILGYTCVRGSASRGGARALLEMIKSEKQAKGFVFTVDGPKGPCYEVKEGVIFLAKKTGLPVIPVTYNVLKKKRLKSWDRFIIPFPFTKAEVIFGQNFYVKEDDNMFEYKNKIQKDLLNYSEK